MKFTLIGKHENDSRANRDAYVTAMQELMAADSKVCHVDCDLYSCINTKKLETEFPKQTFNAGIAEANAMGVAAGLAATGRTVFMHSFGCFSSRRAYDQAFMSCAYAKLPVMFWVLTRAYVQLTTAVPICRLKIWRCIWQFRTQSLSTRPTMLCSTT